MTYFDTDGDGYADAIDLNGDGTIDAVDLNADGYVDAVDLNGDGRVDLVDYNGDGYADAIDYGSDGTLDPVGAGPGFDNAAAQGFDQGFAPGGYYPEGAFDPGGATAPTGIFDGGAQQGGIDLNGDGIVDGYDTDGDGWIDAVGPGAIAAAEANGWTPGGGGGGPFPAGQAPPEDPGRYTQSEINQGYSSYDTSFIEPSRFADDASMIQNGDITDVL